MIWMNELFEGKCSLFATKTLKLLQGTPKGDKFYDSWNPVSINVVSQRASVQYS